MDRSRTLSVLLRGRGSELTVALCLVGLACLVTAVNSAFLTLDNLFDLLRSSIVIGMLALAVMVALASGGIDVSFAAVAAFASYTATKVLLSSEYQGSVLPAFLLAAGIGLLLGSVNAWLIGWFRLPTLIVTLGTLSLYRGLMLTFVGSDYITLLPEGMISFSRISLYEGVTPAGAQFRLPISFLFLVATALVTAWILNRTLLGRGIYALGGSEIAANRVGFNIRRIKLFVYCYIGCVSGIAGLLHVTLVRTANPFDLVGMELNVIAAVVLGGARITGGYGTVTGTLLGIGLIVLINNSLILLGVPTYWQKVVVGALILIGTGLTASRSRVPGNA